MAAHHYVACVSATAALLLLVNLLPEIEAEPVPMSWLETLAAHNCRPTGRLAGTNYRTVVYDCDDGTRVDP